MSTKTKKSAKPRIPTFHISASSIRQLAGEIVSIQRGDRVDAEMAAEAAAPKSDKFTKLDAKGNDLPDSATDFAGVRINALDLIVAKIPMTKMNQQQAEKHCAALDHIGHKDWKLISRLEALNGIWDATKYNPAYDATFWSWIPTNDWCWTRDAFAGDSGGVWGVYFGGGDSSYGLRNGSGYALAVRAAPSQS